MSKTTSSPRHHLARSAVVMGFATSLSRILGFVRDVLIARFFGTGIAAQAFVVAFLIPNLLRDLVAEGAMSAAVIPILASYLRKGKEEFMKLSLYLLNTSILIIGTMSVLGVILAPAIVSLVAPGFLRNPEQFELTVFLTRVLFPFIFLVGLSAYAMGVLNTLQHFFMPAFGPTLLNIGMIASFFFLVPYTHPPVLGLAIGVLVGGAVQCFVQWPILREKGFVYRPQLSFQHPGVRQTGRLLIPRILGSAVYQLSVVIDRVFASLSHIVGEGGVAALYYSNRIVQLPFALFGVSLATAALPTLSTQAHDQGLEEFRKTLLFSLRSAFFVMVPSVVGILVLVRPIVQILFERGQFDTYSTDITTQALSFYVMGLLAFSGSKILSSAFYSLQDTQTPVKAAVVSLIANAVLNAILMFPMKIGGLALATALSSTLHFLILYVLLKKRIGSFGGRTLFWAFCKFCGASLLMTFSLFLSIHFMSGGESRLRVIPFVLVIGVGVISYFVFSLVLKVEEADRLTRWIFKRR
ncbi:MAG: murein biosynthesis integral membrane protein MurJ [Candidatus Omnitrophica bacterium]|nr:murein biosynthesis integral membrane protein MurJ [Candidatus Omnitrophota bacterium]